MANAKDGGGSGKDASGGRAVGEWAESVDMQNDEGAHACQQETEGTAEEEAGEERKPIGSCTRWGVRL